MPIAADRRLIASRVSASAPALKARAPLSISGSRSLPIEFGFLPSSRPASAGITVTDTTSDSRTATEIATAMSRNSWPTSNSMIRIGRNTMTVVRAETSTAPQTWLAPR